MPEPLQQPAPPAVTWDAVLKPGEAGELPGSNVVDPFDGLPPPEPFVRTFSLANACFLAAHSLLIYRGYSDTGSPVFPGRHTILTRLGLTEVFFGEIGGTSVSIVGTNRVPSGSSPVTVVFRGTSQLKNWLTNIQSVPTPWDGGGHVHSGFATVHDEIWDHLGPRLDGFAGDGRPVMITGHSLGGALATLTLSRFLHAHPEALASAYTYGSPRVGTAEFSASFDGFALYRLVNGDDLITRLPFSLALTRRLAFLHCGIACFLDASGHLELRGQGDLPEESVGLAQIAKIIRNASDAFKGSDPPGFLADHAPSSYLEKIHRALGEEERRGWTGQPA